MPTSTEFRYWGWIMVGHVITLGLILLDEPGAIAWLFGWVFGGITFGYWVKVKPRDVGDVPESPGRTDPPMTTF